MRGLAAAGQPGQPVLRAATAFCAPCQRSVRFGSCLYGSNWSPSFCAFRIRTHRCRTTVRTAPNSLRTCAHWLGSVRHQGGTGGLAYACVCGGAWPCEWFPSAPLGRGRRRRGETGGSPCAWVRGSCGGTCPAHNRTQPDRPSRLTRQHREDRRQQRRKNRRREGEGRGRADAPGGRTLRRRARWAGCRS